MIIISWNVLYRQYEESYNPNSTILEQFSDEKIRIQEQFEFIIKESMQDEEIIICLQECSVDLLRLLQKYYKDKKAVFFQAAKSNDDENEKSEDSHINDNKQNTPIVNLNESSDYLVTIAPLNYKRSEWITHAGFRGYILVHNDENYVFNFHFRPQKCVKTYILGTLKPPNIPFDKNVFITGDFNNYYKKVFSALNRFYHIPYFGYTYAQKQIDYIMYRPSYIDSECLYPYKKPSIEHLDEQIRMPLSQTSDHNPIMLKLKL